MRVGDEGKEKGERKEMVERDEAYQLSSRVGH